VREGGGEGWSVRGNELTNLPTSVKGKYILCYISTVMRTFMSRCLINPLNAKLNPICHLLALLGAHHILHVSRIRVKKRFKIKFTLYIHFFFYFPLTQSFQPHYGPGFKSTSNRNEYQEYFLGDKGGRCVGLTTLPPSCADCLEIWKPQPPGNLRACQGLQLDCFTF